MTARHWAHPLSTSRRFCDTILCCSYRGTRSFMPSLRMPNTPASRHGHTKPFNMVPFCRAMTQHQGYYFSTCKANVVVHRSKSGILFGVVKLQLELGCILPSNRSWRPKVCTHSQHSGQPPQKHRCRRQDTLIHTSSSQHCNIPGELAIEPRGMCSWKDGSCSFDCDGTRVLWQHRIGQCEPRHGFQTSLIRLYCL
jgi:hypothetical protein